MLGARLYYVSLARDQPAWWDEAEYLLKARAIALGTPDTGFSAHRPILPSLLAAPFFALGLGEGAIRVALALVSTASVYLMYRLGRRLGGMAAGVTSAALFSVFYLHLFYSNRFMTETPQIALVLFGFELFLSGERRRVMLSGPVLVLAVLTRFTAGLMLPVLALHDLLARRGKTLLSRPFLVSVGLGFLAALPYAVWAQVTEGDPLRAWKSASYLMPPLEFSERLEGLSYHLGWLRERLGWPLSVLALVGVALGFVRPRGVGTLAAGTEFWGPGLLLALWIALPLGYMGLYVRPLEDRHLFLAIPPVFLSMGLALGRAAELLGRSRMPVAWGLLAVVTGTGVVWLHRDADLLIRQKLASQDALRDAGLWLKDNTPSGALVMSGSVAQVTYYSERAGVRIPGSLEATAAFLEEPGPRYLVLSGYERHPPWIGRLFMTLRPERVAQFPPGGKKVVVLAARASRN